MANKESPMLKPDILAYYNELIARNELTRSDVSIYPSYTRLYLPYRVICRKRYAKAARKQRKQFIKEIIQQENLQSRALDGVRLHREFCNPVIQPLAPDELITLTPAEEAKLRRLLAQT